MGKDAATAITATVYQHFANEKSMKTKNMRENKEQALFWDWKQKASVLIETVDWWPETGFFIIIKGIKFLHCWSFFVLIISLIQCLIKEKKNLDKAKTPKHFNVSDFMGYQPGNVSLTQKPYNLCIFQITPKVLKY